MGFKELKEMLSDNTDALELVGSLESTFNTNVSTINALETKFQEAKVGRDSAKSRLKEVQGYLGVDELSQEAIEAIVKSKPDEKSALEIQNLQKQLADATTVNETQAKEFQDKFQGMALERELTTLGASANVANAQALQILTEQLKASAVFNDDGTVSYSNADGTTRYVNGKPMTISDRLSELQGDDNWNFIFKSTVKPGGGSDNNGGGNVSSRSINRLDFEKLEPSAQMKHISGGGTITD